MQDQAKMVLLIKYKKNWKATIDDQISVFATEKAILDHEWDAALYDAQQRLVTGDGLGPENFPLKLEYTRTRKEMPSSSDGTNGQVLPLRPRSTSPSRIYTLIKWIFLFIACLFYLGFFFDGTEFDQTEPGKPVVMWPRFSWILPAGYVSQTRHHFEAGFAKLCFARQQAALLVLILMLMRHKTLPALISIANIGGFGLCFHAYHLKSSAEDRWPMLVASVLAVYVIMFNPDLRLTTNRKLVLIIFMYILGFVSCLLVLGTEPLQMKSQLMQMATSTTTTATPVIPGQHKGEEF